jgi:hypothetical protein
MRNRTLGSDGPSGHVLAAPVALSAVKHGQLGERKEQDKADK